jgi:meso-butanediol dehydrogenase/(S,S)-butanediol dehydrogenase/diacetyl reductase
VLFHNGARLAGVSTVVDHDVTLFQEVINTNLCGLFYLARAAIPQMCQQGKGAIVSTASTAGLRGEYGLCSYAAAKAGLINLTRVMAMDHAREGIRINCVCPGYMVTPMTAGFRESKTLHESLLECIPMNRGSDPKEVANVVLFLASDEASYITGEGMSVICRRVINQYHKSAGLTCLFFLPLQKNSPSRRRWMDRPERWP